MNRLIKFCWMCLLVGVSACLKVEQLPSFEEQLATQLAQIDVYLTDNGIAALQDPNNLIRYVIHDEGDGSESPDLTNCVTTSYKGMLFNGNVFDQNNSISFPLNGVIAGWQVGMQQLVRNDSATFYIPAVLGYGNQNLPGIPANSNLVFNVRLKKIGTTYSNTTGSCN
ncbi:MAG: FKBP-type peptidyl-prolyl cis-trans isomerase [Cyclobacteriaceae bacterium]|nr:FKBP-type peptidyl-prolyl cis-trans isomerase [Cyclobacteriaceae bacterium]